MYFFWRKKYRAIKRIKDIKLSFDPRVLMMKMKGLKAQDAT
jgi:hypothetical protein